MMQFCGPREAWETASDTGGGGFITFSVTGMEQATVIGSDELTTEPPDCVLNIIGFPLSDADA